MKCPLRFNFIRSLPLEFTTLSLPLDFGCSQERPESARVSGRPWFCRRVCGEAGAGEVLAEDGAAVRPPRLLLLTRAVSDRGSLAVSAHTALPKSHHRREPVL